MRATLLSLILVLGAAPAAEARSGPCRTGDVPRVTAKMDSTKVGWRYAVVACDAARQLRVLRRTRVRNSVKRGSLGRAITDAEASGRHVVWAELVHERRRPVRAVVVEADRRGRVARRRTVWRAPYARTDYTVDVAVLRDGSVAWAAPRGSRDVVVLDRPGRRPRSLRPPYESFLGGEDGRTLRWDSGDDRVVYRDVLPLPLRDGCPRRSRFRTISETDAHRVSEGGYSSPEEDTLVGQVLRVCVRAERRDLVVAQTSEGFHAVTQLAAGWAVVWGQAFTKYDCSGESVTRVSLARRPAARRYSTAGECGEGPRPGAAQVVTPAGAVAWVDEPEPPFPDSQPPPQEAVLRATAGARSVVLDRGAPGAITDLRAEGETYRWRNGGVPRSAPAR